MVEEVSVAVVPAIVLSNVAFGDDPGRWPLPPASETDALWLRAVAAGAQGRYAAAFADLDRLAAAAASGPHRPDASLRSLGHSTRGSFLRQLGRHTVARGWDGRAWALADADEPAADALIGLAADALGVGRFAPADRLLDRAAAIGIPTGRVPVRLAWVRAELAMARGDGDGALAHAERGVEAAAAFGSARHALKSDVVHAAALCTAGRLDDARSRADAALQIADRLGLIPLRWALACLLADLGSGIHHPTELTRLRDESAAVLRHRGGVLTAR
jgi:tetratricopeptide (TPR) repeat protein